MDDQSFSYWFVGIFSGGSDGKESGCNVGDLGSIPGLGRSPGEENGYPLQYSCLEKFMDRGVQWSTVHWVAKRHDWRDLTHNLNTNSFPHIF